jgi:hypothetical protein
MKERTTKGSPVKPASRARWTQDAAHRDAIGALQAFSALQFDVLCNSNVVETFGDIYNAVTSSGSIPSETASLFGMFDWDKGKELRKTLIDTFMSSQWPAGDLVLASSERSLFRKMFKRVYRKSSGPRYLQAALEDLQARSSEEAQRMAGVLSTLLKEPDFYEDWD